MGSISGVAGRPSRAGAIVHAMATAMTRWWAAYTVWRIEQWAVGRLSAMSDRQLQDIGLVRSQIPFAVRHGAEVIRRASRRGPWGPYCARPSRGRF
jgi:uncharacterized protein YjiS (DUF1127 family)